MRAWLALLPAAVLFNLAGCAPITGNTLDWQAKSFAKVRPNTVRSGLESLAFAVQTDAKGLAERDAVQEFPIEVRGFPVQASVSLRSLPNFRAVVWFRAFEARKLVLEEVSLSDNRGHQFKLRKIRPTFDCAAELLVAPNENAEWLEFNNRDYFLTLTVRFTYDGKPLTASLPKIYCVFDKLIGN